MCTCLEEVLDSLWVIAVALSADSLHFLHLTSLAGSLRRKKNTTVSTINQGSNPLSLAGCLKIKGFSLLDYANSFY